MKGIERWGLAAVLGVMAGPLAGRVDAGFTAALSSASSTPTTSTFNYSLTFSPTAYMGTASLVAGNYLTLYDVAASQSAFASISTGGLFTASEQLVGLTPSFITSPPDSATLYNLTFVYSGPTVTTSANFNVGFTLNGLYSTAYTVAVGFDQYNPSAGGTGQEATTFAVLTPTAVPEPPSLALCGVASLAGLGLAARRRRVRGEGDISGCRDHGAQILTSEYFVAT